MPEITNVEAIIDEVAPVVDHVYVYRLRMKAETDTNWLRVKHVLHLNYPELVGPYRRIVFSPEDPYWADLRSRLRKSSASHEGKLTIEV